MEDNSSISHGAQAAPRRNVRQSASFSIDFKDMVSLIVDKWYWFVISLVLTMGLATLYLMRTPRQYISSTLVVVPGEDAPLPSGLDLSVLGIQPKASNVTNQIRMLESPSMLSDVVARLGLNNRYYTKDGLRMVDLYKSSPIIVTPADTVMAESYKFTVALDGNKNFLLSDFGPQYDGVTVKGSLGQTVKTPLGLFTIATSPWYQGNPYIDSDIVYSHVPVEVAGNALPAIVKAYLDEGRGSVIRIEAIDVSPQRCVDMLNCLLEVYRDREIAEQARSAKSTTEFINNRLAIIEEDLGSVDGDISSFKSYNLIPDVSSASAMYFNQSFQTRQELLSINSEIAMAQFVRRELQNEGVTTTLPVNSGLQGLGIQGQIAEYNNLVMERNRLLGSTGENNPVIVEMTTTLTTLKNNMLRSLDNYITTLHSQLGNLQTTENAATGELAANPQREKFLLSIERQQKVKESLYMFLLQKREESELTQAYVKSDFEVMARPMLPREPIAPRSMNILVIAFAVGIMAPLVIIFVRESLVTTVRSRKDLVASTIPFVGEIPYGPGKKPVFKFTRQLNAAGPGDIVVKHGSNNIINEAFRAIRTSLQFMVPEHAGRGRVISVTSARAGSGKTYITMNLAAVLAISGKKVLVIDLDMRKAALSKMVPGRHDEGISTYLLGRSSLNDVIVHGVDGFSDIDVVPVGLIPPNPVELLSGSRLNEMFKELATCYDYILIDCPPAEVVADARIISSQVDMTLFVVRAGLFEKSMLDDLEEFNETGRYKNLALILNGTDPNSLYRRRRYSYGYGYGKAAY